MRSTPNLLIAALVAGLFIQGTLTLPVDTKYDVSHRNFVEVRAPAGGARPPKHDLDSDSDKEFPDTKRPDPGTGSGSDSDQSGAVPGRVWGQNPESNPSQQGGQSPDQPPPQHFGGTPGFIPVDQAGIAAPPARHPDPTIAKAQERGEKNIRAYNDARDQNLPTNDHNYAQVFRDNYFRKPEQGRPEVDPDVANWLRTNGIDPNAPDVQKVRVFGYPFDPDAPGSPAVSRDRSPNSESDSEIDSDKDQDDTSIFEAYMSPSGGWMYRTRMFRDAEYDNFYQLPVQQRLPMSEIMAQQWKDVAGDLPLRKVVGANVEARDTVVLLDDLRRTTGRNEGVITPADGPRFDQAIGVSQGNVVSFMVRDHHSEPIVPGVPVSVAWRHTGMETRSADPNAGFTEYKDSFLLVDLGN